MRAACKNIWLLIKLMKIITCKTKKIKAHTNPFVWTFLSFISRLTLIITLLWFSAKRRSANHPCPVCGKFYVNEGSLRKHLACHPEMTSQLSSSLRMWPCSVCTAVFTHENGKFLHDILIMWPGLCSFKPYHLIKNFTLITEKTSWQSQTEPYNLRVPVDCPRIGLFVVQAISLGPFRRPLRAFVKNPK